MRVNAMVTYWEAVLGIVSFHSVLVSPGAASPR